MNIFGGEIDDFDRTESCNGRQQRQSKGEECQFNKALLQSLVAEGLVLNANFTFDCGALWCVIGIFFSFFLFFKITFCLPSGAWQGSARIRIFEYIALTVRGTIPHLCSDFSCDSDTVGILSGHCVTLSDTLMPCL